MVPETSLIFNQLVRLIAREEHISFDRHESFRSYNIDLCLFLVVAYLLRLYHNLASIFNNVQYFVRKLEEKQVHASSIFR